MSAKPTQSSCYEFSPIIDRKSLKLPNGRARGII